jgi:nucleoside-diphosphate-sugar epimerase
MKFKNILVTGGGGYVGAVLIPKLLKKGYKVTVLDWFVYGENVFGKYDGSKNLLKIKGDIRDEKTLKKALSGVEAVLHLACISNDPSFELNPQLGKTVNYDATKLLVGLAKDSGVKRFIYASSSSVYGVKTEKQVNEKLSLEPLTDYSKYKALSEEYILSRQADDFVTLILRPATVCGYSPRMRLDLTVNILTINALVNKIITVNGGMQTRPNIHIEDMTDLYVKTLNYPDRLIAGKIFNAGFENHTVMDIAKMVKRTIGDKNISIIVKPTNDKRSYRINSGKISKELGFVPKRTISDAVRDIVRAYKKGLLHEPLTNQAYYNISTMKNSNFK